MPATGQGAVIVEVSAFEALASGTILGGRVDVSGLIQSSSAASLAVTPGSLTFSLSQGGQAASQPLTVVNQGSQSANFHRDHIHPLAERQSGRRQFLAGSARRRSPSPPRRAVYAPGTYTGAVAIQSGGVLLTPVAGHDDDQRRAADSGALAGGAELPRGTGRRRARCRRISAF